MYRVARPELWRHLASLPACSCGCGYGGLVAATPRAHSCPNPSQLTPRHFSASPSGRERWRTSLRVSSSSIRSISSTSLSLGSEGAPHFKQSSVQHPLAGKISSLPSEEKVVDYTLPHPIWSREEADAVKIHHTPPKDKVDKAAYVGVRTMRLFFDLFSGYSWGKLVGTLDERKWLTRIIFLETVAGVPGMIGAMTRHLKSLRMLQRDNGWIHTLLEEAENERMHLLTALELRNPSRLFKGMVVGAQGGLNPRADRLFKGMVVGARGGLNPRAEEPQPPMVVGARGGLNPRAEEPQPPQGVFVTMFWIVYAISPRFCHRFVGYLEEEAVRTYTHCLESIDQGHLPMWEKMPAPPIAVNYWMLPEGAMMRDVILAIRADEAHHRTVNHTLSNMKRHEKNPYHPGQ